MKKLFLCDVELSEEMPYYTFFVNANNEKGAEDKAKKIAIRDYGDYHDIFTTEINSLEELYTIE